MPRQAGSCRSCRTLAAMCLELTITLAENAKAQVGAERLSKHCGLSVRKYRDASGSHLHVSGDGGCSCDLLARGKNQEGLYWVLDPARLEALSEAVSLVSKESKRFSLAAHWLGDESSEPKQVKLNELLRMIRENQVPRNTELLVGAGS
jgi:hypothetical protein